MSPEDTAEFRQAVLEYREAILEEASKTMHPHGPTRTDRARTDKAHRRVLKFYIDLAEECQELRAELERRGDPR